MIYASIIVEALRVRPVLVFWLAAIGQALMWFLVPTLFYAAPPGNLAEVLTIGHAYKLGTLFGPPLAYWVADLAYTLAGGRLAGIYLLAQLCVLITLWSLMRLGTSIVGVRQSVLAVLLMVGVSAAVVPTPDFGPYVLAMPLWSLILLHTWRIFDDGRRRYWFILAIEIGLLLLTTWLALVLIALLDLFLIEKALYELCYAAANRPGWLRIPLKGVAGMLHLELEETDPPHGTDQVSPQA